LKGDGGRPRKISFINMGRGEWGSRDVSAGSGVRGGRGRWRIPKKWGRARKGGGGKNAAGNWRGAHGNKKRTDRGNCNYPFGGKVLGVPTGPYGIAGGREHASYPTARPFFFGKKKKKAGIDQQEQKGSSTSQKKTGDQGGKSRPPQKKRYMPPPAKKEEKSVTSQSNKKFSGHFRQKGGVEARPKTSC